MFFDYYDYFYKVAQLGNITKAANEIHISQSALSKTILKLEKSLDCQLFYRTPKGVKLTPAGEVLYEGVKKSIALMTSTNQQIQRLKHTEYEEIRIGTGEDLFLRYVLPQAKQYAQKYPNVLFSTVATMSSESSINGILRRDIDLGFLNVRPEHDSIGYECLGILHEIFLAGDIYGAQLGTAPVTWQRLLQHPLLLHPKYTYTRKRLDDKVNSMGLAAIANFESGNTHVLMKMAEENLGIALVAKETAQTHPIYDSLQIIKLVEPYEPRDIYVAWNKEKKMSIYLQQLIESVVEYSKA